MWKWILGFTVAFVLLYGFGAFGEEGDRQIASPESHVDAMRRATTATP
jgi:hypothetical protein